MDTARKNRTGPNVVSENIYEVEKIIKRRYHPKRGMLYYVKWRNFPNSSNTWEPAGNFSQILIDNFESNLKPRGKRRKINPAGDDETMSCSSEAIEEQIFFEPKTILEPILVTDVISQNATLTFSECSTPDGFFRVRQNKTT